MVDRVEGLQLSIEPIKHPRDEKNSGKSEDVVKELETLISLFILDVDKTGLKVDAWMWFTDTLIRIALVKELNVSIQQLKSQLMTSDFTDEVIIQLSNEQAFINRLVERSVERHGEIYKKFIVNYDYLNELEEVNPDQTVCLQLVKGYIAFHNDGSLLLATDEETESNEGNGNVNVVRLPIAEVKQLIHDYLVHELMAVWKDGLSTENITRGLFNEVIRTMPLRYGLIEFIQEIVTDFKVLPVVATGGIYEVALLIAQLIGLPELAEQLGIPLDLLVIGNTHFIWGRFEDGGLRELEEWEEPRDDDIMLGFKHVRNIPGHKREQVAESFQEIKRIFQEKHPKAILLHLLFALDDGRSGRKVFEDEHTIGIAFNPDEKIITELDTKLLNFSNFVVNNFDQTRDTIQAVLSLVMDTPESKAEELELYEIFEDYPDLQPLVEELQARLVEKNQTRLESRQDF